MRKEFNLLAWNAEIEAAWGCEYGFAFEW